MICLECGKEFEPYRLSNKYCSSKCSKVYWWKNNPEKRKASAKKSSRNNAEKRRERQRRYDNKNVEKATIRVREWRRNNPDKRKAQDKKWYDNHREQRRQSVSAWAKEHPENIRANGHKRRTKITEAGGYFTPEEWLTLCVACDFKCLCCKKKEPLTADHVIPVSKGGTSWISNIQPLCKPCNSRKKDKTIDYREP